jgi:hypothetical protein
LGPSKEAGDQPLELAATLVTSVVWKPLKPLELVPIGMNVAHHATIVSRRAARGAPPAAEPLADLERLFVAAHARFGDDPRRFGIADLCVRGLSGKDPVALRGEHLPRRRAHAGEGLLRVDRLELDIARPSELVGNACLQLSH